MDLRTKTFREMVGTTILDRYEIQALLGAGGMGAVFKGMQTAVNRTVAIKVLPKLDPLTAARFHREAKTASRLSHPNTITVFDFGQTQEGFLFLVMEYLEGRTLGDALKEMGAFPPRRAVHIANQICRSLAEAHTEGIVHRDIKPDNIFLIHRNDDPDFVKVLDFGIAKIMAGDDSDDDLTQQGRIVGTPRYMAPEQVLGLPIDHRADVYSLGCILYQMLTGSPPFDDSSTAMLMMKHAHEQPAEFMYRLSDISSDSIPVGLEAVVMKALCKRPEERQQTVDMLRTELDLVLPMGGFSQSMSQPMLRRSTSMAPVSRRFDKPPVGPHTPSGAMPQVHDPSNPSGSNPSLSHPALVPRTALPTGSGAWPVTVNQQRASVSQSHQPVTPPQGSPPPMMTPVPSGQTPVIVPPGASASGDYSGDVWPPPNRNRVIIFAVLGTLMVVALILAALAAGFFIAQPDTAVADAKSSGVVASEDKNKGAQAPNQNQTKSARITIRSEPTGATIYNNDEPVGETPMVIDVSNDEDEVRYTVKLEGHQPVTRRFVVSNISPGGEEWDIELDKLGEAPVVAENDEKPEDDEVKEEPKKDTTNRGTKRTVKTNQFTTKRNKPTNQGKSDEKKDVKPVAENPPKGDNDSAAKEDTANKGNAKKDDKSRKPKVNALDGGGSKKPKVNALDGGGTKKPKVNALDSGKPKVKALE